MNTATQQAAQSGDADKLEAWFNSILELPEMDTARGQKMRGNLSAYLSDLGGDINDFQKLIREEEAA